MPYIPLGVSTWSFNGLAPARVRAAVDGGRPFTPGDEESSLAYFTELADTILDSNIASVELWYSEVLQQRSISRQLGRLSSAGKIRSVHAPFAPHMDLSSPGAGIRQVGISACCRTAQLASDLGGKILVVHGSSLPSTPDDIPERLKTSAASLGEVADFCGGLGLQIALEILTRPNLGDTDDELLTILSMANRPNIGFCVDVNHVFPPKRLVETVQKLGSRILTLHISDYDGIAERHWLPSQGIIAWGDLVKALTSVGYAGPFLYEVRFEAEGIRGAADTIMQNYAEIAG